MVCLLDSCIRHLSLSDITAKSIASLMSNFNRAWAQACNRMNDNGGLKKWLGEAGVPFNDT